ncbi:MAG: protein kinase [Myxococcota bacterium]|nr:protein kinase [Myxococcota bacterium]
MNCPHCHAPNASEARFCGSCGKATSSTEPVSNPGLDTPPPNVIGREVAGRYRILAKLGEGGMGTVYRAEQISLKRTIALKMLRPDVGGGSLILRRFNAEAEAVAKLSHPNTVNIFDFGQDADGMLFIAMEFIEGRSLRAAIHAEAPLPVRRALTIASQVCASIADAHSHSIVHRDLKPDNVMLQDRGKQRDVVRVLDFGIAKLRDDTRANNQMTQAGDMLGTPQYMAPEQIRAEQIDGRTDVYALGCMLYEMLTARLPFEGPTVMALLSKHLMETPPPPSQRRPDLNLPPMIDDLVMGAMAKDPAHRPATMEQFGEHIHALLATLPADPAGPSAPLSVPYVPSPAVRVDTPQAYSALASPTSQPFAPHTPPPPVHAPTPPPPYNPIPPPPAAPTFQIAQPPSGSKRTMLLIIGLVVLGAAGVGIYFATKSPSKTDPTPSPDPSPDPQPDPEDKDDPEDNVDPDDKGSAVDPWGGASGSPSPTASTGGLDGDSLDIGQGAKFIVPPGFVAQTNNDGVMVIDASRGIFFGFAAIDADTDDARTLAKRYASATGLKLTNVSSELLQGEQRKFAVFEGKMGGIAVRHVVIAFLSPSYRIGMIIHVPQSIGNDPTVQALAMEAASRRLVLP